MEEASTSSQIIQYLSDGFESINNPRGLIIALIATFFIRHWRQVAPVSALAVLVHFAVGQMQTSGEGDEEAIVGFSLPQLTDTALWRDAGAMFFGYLLAVSLFFAIKWLMITGGSSSSKKAAH